MITESEEIIAFVKKSINGRRWIDIENEFCNKKGEWAWSKGKFVNHWKKAKPYLERRQTSNRKGYRYFVRESSDEEATKLVWAKALKEQKLNMVEIPKEEMEKKIPELARDYRDFIVRRASFVRRRKLRRSYEHQFLNFWEEYIRKKNKFWDVLIQHPPGVSTLEISEGDKRTFLFLLTRHSASRESIEKLAKKSFRIILSYTPTSEEESDEERQEILNRRIAAWQEDRGIRKMTPKHLKEFEEDYLEMNRLLLKIP